MKFRFMNEDLLAAKAMQRPVFGWGGWGRSRVFSEETGEDLTVTDGLWIIILGSSGFFGLITLMSMLLLPAILLRRLRVSHAHRCSAEQPLIPSIYSLL